MRGKLVHELQLLVRVRVWGWVRVMVEFGTSSAFRGWVRVRVLGYGFGVRGRKVKSRDCALASDLVRAIVQSKKCGTHPHLSFLNSSLINDLEVRSSISKNTIIFVLWPRKLFVI